MSERKDHIIVTDGDAQINTITTLGELQYLSSCLSQSIMNLNLYVDYNLEESKQKKVISK